MMKRKPRPIDLRPAAYLPLPALASIMHRITGILLVPATGFLLYLLDAALTSEAGLARARSLAAQPLPKLILLFVLATLSYHFVAGIRHMLLDFEVGDSLRGGRLSSAITFAATILLTILWGFWIW